MMKIANMFLVKFRGHYDYLVFKHQELDVYFYLATTGWGTQPSNSALFRSVPAPPGRSLLSLVQSLLSLTQSLL